MKRWLVLVALLAACSTATPMTTHRSDESSNHVLVAAFKSLTADQRETICSSVELLGLNAAIEYAYDQLVDFSRAEVRNLLTEEC